MLFGFCQLSLVVGLGANAYTDAYFTNAFGGGLTGALFADQLGYGGLFNDFVGGNALSNPDTSNLLLYSSFAPPNGQFGNVLNTYFGANALANDPNNFLLAGTFGGASSNQLLSPYVANAFGGGLQGAFFADTFLPQNNFNQQNSPFNRRAGRFGGVDYSCTINGMRYADCRWAA